MQTKLAAQRFKDEAVFIELNGRFRHHSCENPLGDFVNILLNPRVNKLRRGVLGNLNLVVLMLHLWRFTSEELLCDNNVPVELREFV